MNQVINHFLPKIYINEDKFPNLKQLAHCVTANIVYLQIFVLKMKFVKSKNLRVMENLTNQLDCTSSKLAVDLKKLQIKLKTNFKSIKIYIIKFNRK